MLYADTSFLVSLFVHEKYSEQASSFLSRLRRPLLLSRLTRLEWVSALQLRVFRGEITLDQVLHHRRNLEILENAGNLITDTNDAHIWHSAEKLAFDYSHRLGTRSLDVWHVAFAFAKNSEWFLSFDLKQRTLAESLGFKLNPMD